MFKWVSLGAGALILSGCALPVPFQIASWALDGISMLATQKSVTDHGISLVADKDCAVWRGVTEGELCRENSDGDVLVAEDAVKMPSVNSLQVASSLKPNDDVTIMTEASISPIQYRTLQVRAVPTHALRAAWAESVRQPSSVVMSPANSHAMRSTPVSINTKPKVKLETVPVPIQRAVSIKPAPEKIAEFNQTRADTPEKGIYFVIGSFRNPGNAQRLVTGNGKLSPAVLSAKLDGSDVYRVVVGPVPRGREKRLHRALARNGFPDTWAIRINPSDWQFAKLPTLRSKASPEVATLLK